MAIVSIGYDGTVDETQWAQMVSKVGVSEYGVDRAGDFATSIIAGDRAVAVASGTAWGMGVLDVSDSSVNLLLDPVASGSRWDLIVLRRDWEPPGGSTVVAVVKGGSAKQIPPGRNMGTPGVLDDQPIALVRVMAGSTAVQEIVDLRVWSRNGGMLFAKHDLVRSYTGAIGTEVNVDGILWQRSVGDNGTAVWVKVGPRSDSQWVHRTNLTAKPGWKVSYLRYRVKDGIVQILLDFERTGGDIAVTADGNIPAQAIANAPQAIVPRIWWAPLVSGAGGRIITGSIASETGVIAIDAVTQTKIRRGEGFTLTGTYFQD